MAGMPWVKVYTEILDDIKLARLSDAQKWRFIQFIVMAGDCDAGGAIVTGDTCVSHEEMCWRLRCDSQTLSNDIAKLTEVGLLLIEDGLITVSKFSERQGPTQEVKREAWRKRQETHRDKVKQSIVTHDSPVTHELVTPQSRVEESRSEEPPSTTFSHLSAMVASKLHMTEHAGGPAKWIKAITDILELDAQECDIDAALRYLDDKKMSITGPWSLVNPISIAKGQRERGNNNGTKPGRHIHPDLLSHI
jgi:hypothetical protein